MCWRYLNLVKEAELAEYKKDYKLAIQKYKQCLEKGVQQSGNTTKKYIRGHIIDLKKLI